MDIDKHELLRLTASYEASGKKDNMTFEEFVSKKVKRRRCMNADDYKVKKEECEGYFISYSPSNRLCKTCVRKAQWHCTSFHASVTAIF